MATKLTGQPLLLNESTVSLMINTVNLTSGAGFDFSYTLSNLLFYTEYNISLVAVYNGNQMSVSVNGQATTVEGGTYATV